MPNPSFVVDGLVYDIDGTTLLSGALITAINITTSEELPTGATYTTAGDGAYILDLANLASGASTNDVVLIKATKSGTAKIKEKEITIAGTVKTQDITMTYYDPVEMIKEILSDNWQKGRTDLIKPSIARIDTIKRLDLKMLGTTDYVLVYERSMNNVPNSIGSTTKKMVFGISIDARTTSSKLRSVKLRNEIDRVMGSKIINPASEYDIINPDKDWLDLSNKSISLWRHVMEIDIEKLNVTRTNIWH